MLAVLSARQRAEIETYAGIETIPDVGKPKDEEEEPTAMFDRIKVALGCSGGKKKKGKRR